MGVRKECKFSGAYVDSYSKLGSDRAQLQAGRRLCLSLIMSRGGYWSFWQPSVAVGFVTLCLMGSPTLMVLWLVSTLDSSLVDAEGAYPSR
jgi:hypothetical protein